MRQFTYTHLHVVVKMTIANIPVIINYPIKSNNLILKPRLLYYRTVYMLVTISFALLGLNTIFLKKLSWVRNFDRIFTLILQISSKVKNKKKKKR